MPLVIVGNKSDLKGDSRQVTKSEGEALAHKYKCAFTEASARANENVTKTFELLIAEAEKSQNPNEPTGGANKCLIM